jgi:hypothetical protein
MSKKKKPMYLKDIRKEAERKRKARQRDAWIAYLGLGLLLALVVYSIILQVIHHL